MEEIELLRPPDPGPATDRLTAQVSFYHQAAGEQPTEASCRFWGPLETQEQPWVRRIRVGAEWQPLLDARCWLELCGYVILENRAGAGLRVNPTPEEKMAIAAQVLQWGVQTENGVVPAGHVRPGRFMALELVDAHATRVRSLGAELSAHLTVYPR